MYVNISIVDVDECENHDNNCQQNCNNTIGSYTCWCNEGYELDSSGYRCNGIYERN